eukprot:6177523-Pleurochrysis_carterae.AAC.1
MARKFDSRSEFEQGRRVGGWSSCEKNASSSERRRGETGYLERRASDGREGRCAEGRCERSPGGARGAADSSSRSATNAHASL